MFFIKINSQKIGLRSEKLVFNSAFNISIRIAVLIWPLSLVFFQPSSGTALRPWPTESFLVPLRSLLLLGCWAAEVTFDDLTVKQPGLFYDINIICITTDGNQTFKTFFFII